MSRAGRRSVVVVGVLVMMTTVFASAQQQTTSTTTKTFEVITIVGNDLVVKLPEGTRQLTVPDDVRFTVNGKQMSVRDLKPGMKGTAAITTKTTLYPVSVTEVKNGTVRQVTGSTILVQTNEGFRSFTQSEVDKRGVKIVRDGKTIELADLRSGDSLTATIVTSRPPRVVTEREVQATLARTAAAAAPSSAQTAAAPPASPSAAQVVERPGATSGTTRKLPKTASPLPSIALLGAALPDQGLWSPERIVAWRNAGNESRPPLIATLRIPRLRLEAPVVEGTDDRSLNRALGRIEDTAALGTDGNAGIAGHRDGFFRGLKDIVPGDAIELETLHAREVYRVERTWIVVPEDVWVLEPTPRRSLTLVTCYPFHFVGSAPQRFIVRAVLAETIPDTARRQP